MKLITAIVRPEKVPDILEALESEKYYAYSKWPITGRGKEKGIKVGEIFYQEMAKQMIYIVVEDTEKDEVVDLIINSAKSGKNGSRGDGKIYVTDIMESYTISEECQMES